MRAFTSNRDGMESHLSRKLHNQVPKAANTLYSGQVSSAARHCEERYKW